MTAQDSIQAGQFGDPERNARRPRAQRAARLQEIRKAMPEVVAHSPYSGGSGRERERVAMALARSSLPVEHLEGLGRIHTGDRSIGGKGQWGKIEREPGKDWSGKPGIQMSHDFHEYGEVPNYYIRGDRQVTLLHEIGHHVEHKHGVLSPSQFAAGEARAENFGYHHACGNKGQEGLSEYDDEINRPRGDLKRRWGHGQVAQYKAERAAGNLPGEKTAPKARAREWEPHRFGAAREDRERPVAQRWEPEREAG